MNNVEPIFSNTQILQQIREQAREPIEPTEADIEQVRHIMAAPDGWPLKSAVALFLTQRLMRLW